MNVINFFFVFILLLVIVFFRKKNKHQKNIYNSKKVISKLNSFEYDGQKMNYLKKIDPFLFEELLLTAFKSKGYRIVRNKRYTGDGGIDGIIFDRQNNKYLIQAKRYSNYINLAHVKEFGLLIKKEKCKGFFIHTGKTGKNSFKETFNHDIKIISGQNLIKLITIDNEKYSLSNKF